MLFGRELKSVVAGVEKESSAFALCVSITYEQNQKQVKRGLNQYAGGKYQIGNSCWGWISDPLQTWGPCLKAWGIWRMRRGADAPHGQRANLRRRKKQRHGGRDKGGRTWGKDKWEFFDCGVQNEFSNAASPAQGLADVVEEVSLGLSDPAQLWPPQEGRSSKRGKSSAFTRLSF